MGFRTDDVLLLCEPHHGLVDAAGREAGLGEKSGPWEAAETTDDRLKKGIGFLPVVGASAEGDEAVGCPGMQTSAIRIEDNAAGDGRAARGIAEEEMISGEGEHRFVEADLSQTSLSRLKGFAFEWVDATGDLGGSEVKPNGSASGEGAAGERGARGKTRRTEGPGVEQSAGAAEGGQGDDISA